MWLNHRANDLRATVADWWSQRLIFPPDFYHCPPRPDFCNSPHQISWLSIVQICFDSAGCGFGSLQSNLQSFIVQHPASVGSSFFRCLAFTLDFFQQAEISENRWESAKSPRSSEILFWENLSSINTFWSNTQVNKIYAIEQPSVAITTSTTACSICPELAKSNISQELENS